MARLIDIDKKIIVPITDETKGGMVYETEMTVAELFSRFLPDYQPEIVNAISVEWLQDKMDEADGREDWGDFDAIEWLLMMWRKEQEAR